MRRHGGNPEVVPSDIEGGGPAAAAAKTVSMAGPGGRPLIQPFQGISPGSKPAGRGSRSGSYSLNSEGLKNIGMGVCGIWLLGWLFLGYDMLWPVYLVSNIFYSIGSFPPFSWVFGWMYRGAPMLSHSAPAEELQLPSAQVPQYTDTYVNQYGDAALIFATHDGYPQIVKGLLFGEDYGYRDLIDARDDAGNTALLYAAAKGFKQCTAALLRAGAYPEEANQGGRTPLMEAAGGGFKEIVMALRLTPNITIDKTDDYGNTALHYAAYHGHLSVVMELLKSDPNKDIQNIYGHTPASYAASNKHKAIADVLNRSPTRSQRMAKEAEKKDDDSVKDFQQKFQEQLSKMKTAKKEEKHVKGSAEELHKENEDFAPKYEKLMNQLNEKEEKALEEQLSKLRRAHEEAELRSQKKIVELLERSGEQQKAIDKARLDHRELQINSTEMVLKVAELESKHRASESRAQEEAERAAALQEQHRRAQLEADEHRSRAEALERERDQHADASRRHADSVKRMQDEVSSHLTRLENQQREMSQLRDQLSRADEERRRHQELRNQLQRELEEARRGGGGAAARRPDSPPADPAAPPAVPAADTRPEPPAPAPAPLAEQPASDGPAAVPPAGAVADTEAGD